jgi:hypothetical protein
MEFLSVVSITAQVAIAVIILYYVVELLPMPSHMKMIVQALIILVALLAVLSSFATELPSNPVTPSRPNSPANPSIIK